MLVTQHRLLQRSDLPILLQLPETKIQWLIDTQQIRPIVLCGEERFDAKEIDRLIANYQQVATRKNQNDYQYQS